MVRNIEDYIESGLGSLEWTKNLDGYISALLFLL
jgi:hypothetical protein